MIYFILCEEVNAVKIGFAKSPRLRLNKIRSDCPGTVKLLAVVNGGVEEERALHNRFADHRKRGEWFHFRGRLADHINALPQIESTEVRRGSRRFVGALAEYLRDTNTSVGEFAKKIDVSGETIRRYVNGTRRPNSRIVRRIVLATGGKVTPNQLFHLPDEAEAA